MCSHFHLGTSTSSWIYSKSTVIMSQENRGAGVLAASKTWKGDSTKGTAGLRDIRDVDNIWELWDIPFWRSPLSRSCGSYQWTSSMTMMMESQHCRHHRQHRQHHLCCPGVGRRHLPIDSRPADKPNVTASLVHDDMIWWWRGHTSYLSFSNTTATWGQENLHLKSLNLRQKLSRDKTLCKILHYVQGNFFTIQLENFILGQQFTEPAFVIAVTNMRRGRGWCWYWPFSWSW